MTSIITEGAKYERDHLYEEAWIDGSESEKKVFYDRYIKTLSLKVDQEGNFTVEVKSQK